MAEYFLEIRSQELPAGRLAAFAQRFVTRLFEDLMSRGLGPEETLTGATCRRLCIAFKGLPDVEPEREERELGPALTEARDEAGEPTEALLGFAERVDVPIDQLTEVQTERGVYLAAVRERPGRPIAEVLAETVPAVLAGLLRRRDQALGSSWWLRPVTGIVSLLDGEILPLAITGNPASLPVTDSTSGHVFHSPDMFVIESWQDYETKLLELGIVVPQKRRRLRLQEACRQAAEQAGGVLLPDKELLDRLAASCEIPSVLVGSFDPSHLAMPRELLIETLATQHQSFCVVSGGDDSAGVGTGDGDGNSESELLPFFITGLDRLDDPDQLILRGQQRAAAGHLADARFHYDNDRRQALAERVRRLDQLTFHPVLGTYAEMGERTKSLVELVCGELGWDEWIDPALQAAQLMKADLATDVVLEYPSLRGTIGGLYAREEGYGEVVWRAIYQQYLPQSVEQGIPQEPVGQALAVADRLGTLVGFFGVAEAPPSGSKDPFALRRLAQGLLRIVIEGRLNLDLDLLAARAVLLFGDRLERSAESLLGDLQAFFDDRLDHLLGRRGFAFDEIEAAKAVGSGNLPDLVHRIEALRAVRDDANFRTLVQAAKRISNMIRDLPEHELAPEALVEPAEIELHEALGAVSDRVDQAIQHGHYEDALRQMMELVPPLEQFFADVLVMDEDERLRANRVALLQSCRRLFWRLARLKEMAVDRGESA